MSGLKGQQRVPRLPARLRRNVDNLSNRTPFAASNTGIEVDNGVFQLRLATGSPFTQSSGLDLTVGDGLVNSSGTLEADLGNGMTIVSGAIEPDVGDGLTLGATLAVDLAAGGHLSFSSGALQVDDDFVLNTGDTVTGTLVVNDNVNPEGVLFQSVTLAGPTTGLMEFDGEALHFAPLTDDRTLNLAGDVITSDTTVANTTTETTVYTESISPNELHVGQAITCRVLGRYSTANATDTFTARLKIGGTTVASVVSTADNVTDGGFDLEFVITTRSTGATGSVIHHLTAVFNNEVKTNPAASTTAVDTTASTDITVTIEWSAADSGNTVTVTQGWCEYIR